MPLFEFFASLFNFDDDDNSLEESDLPPVNTMASSTPKGYYVIIGRGFSAVLNHTTLRQRLWGRSRLGGLPVMHIGFDNPWSHYMKHGMGQFPHLLGLPGYSLQPTDEDPDEPRDSTKFGNEAKTELASLVENYDVTVKKGWVALIQPRGLSVPQKVMDILEAKAWVNTGLLYTSYGKSLPPYRLLVVDSQGDTELVYAHKIDICTGGGIPRLIASTGINKGYYDAYVGRPWQPPEDQTSFRYVINGQEALYDNTPAPGGSRVCVQGSGGIGVNLVETRVEQGKWVDWMATSTHHAAFAPSGRNDVLLKGGTLDDRQNGALIPFHKKLRFGQGIGVRTAVGGQVTFEQSARAQGATVQVTDFYSNVIPLDSGHFPYSDQSQNDDSSPAHDYYAQLLVTSGFITENDPGTAHFIVQLAGTLSVITSHDGRMVGLQSKNEAVRILGQTAMAFPAGGVTDTTGARAKTIVFHKTLPYQAQVGGPEGLAGITFNALNVALANGFFTGDSTYLNKNVNTASPVELRQSLGDENDKLDKLVLLILTQRGTTKWGFRNSTELANAIGRGDTSLIPNNWRERIAGLSYSYT